MVAFVNTMGVYWRVAMACRTEETFGPHECTLFRREHPAIRPWNQVLCLVCSSGRSLRLADRHTEA